MCNASKSERVGLRSSRLCVAVKCVATCSFLTDPWCFLSAEKTTRTATVTIPWLLPWMEINLYWGARTTTKHPRGRRITRLRARPCSSAQTPVYSPCTAWRPRRDPAPSRYQVAQSRCTITTHCTTTPYWTLCLLIWWTSALKKRQRIRTDSTVFSPSSSFFFGKVVFRNVRLASSSCGTVQTDWNTAQKNSHRNKSFSLIFNLKVFFNKWGGKKKSANLSSD